MTRTNPVNAYSNNLAFRGDDNTTQKSNGNGMGIASTVGGGLLGAAGGYFGFKSPMSQDAFEKSISSGETISPKEGQTFTAEENKAIEDAKAAKGSSAVTNPATSTTTSDTAGKSEALIAAEKTENKAKVQYGYKSEALKSQEDIAKEIVGIRDELAAGMAGTTPKVDAEETQRLTADKARFTTELAKEEERLKHAKDTKDATLKKSAEEAINRLKQNIAEVDKKLLSPAQHKLNAALDAAEKKLKEATDSQKKIGEEQTDKKEKAADQLKAAEKEAAREEEKLRATEEFQNLDAKEQEKRIKQIKDKVKAAEEHKNAVYAEAEHVNALAQEKVTARTAIHNALKTNASSPESALTAITDLQKTTHTRITDTFKVELEKADNTLKAASTAVVDADSTSATDVAKKSKVEARLASAKASAPVTTAEKASGKESSVFSELVSKAYEAVKGKLPEGHSWAKAGIGLAAGAAIGLGIKYLLDGNKSEA